MCVTVRGRVVDVDAATGRTGNDFFGVSQQGSACDIGPFELVP